MPRWTIYEYWILSKATNTQNEENIICKNPKSELAVADVSLNLCNNLAVATLFTKPNPNKNRDIGR